MDLCYFSTAPFQTQREGFRLQMQTRRSKVGLTRRDGSSRSQRGREGISSFFREGAKEGATAEARALVENATPDSLNAKKT